MPGNPDDNELPHLEPETISERDHEEYRLRQEIQKCTPYDGFDRDRADHIVRGFAVRIFVLELEAYMQAPGYNAKWIDDIADESVTRVLVQVNGIYEQKEMFPLYERLVKTVLKHVRAHAILRVISGIAELDASQARQQESAPALRATKVIPTQPKTRSVYSPAAVERVEAYVSTHGLTYAEFAVRAKMSERTLRSFRKTKRIRASVLDSVAEAMKITREQLING